MFTALSCSTTRVLSDGQKRLVANDIQIEGSGQDISTSELERYVAQSTGTFSWSPFMCVYNWQNGKGGAWDRFVTRIGTPPLVYDSSLVENSRQRMQSHLEYLGYFGSTVSHSVKENASGKKVSVTYNVKPGSRIYIKSINFDIPKGEFEDYFYKDTANVLIHTGMPLSKSILEKESERSAKVLRNSGFYTFNKNHYFFEADTIGHRDSADLQVCVKEYTRNETASEAHPLCRFTYDNVTISYPKSLKINEKILTRLNTIKPGHFYDEEEVNNAYNRLSSLKLFNSVNIQTTKSGDDKVDCAINLSQSKLQGYKLNLEGSTNSSGLFGISPQISYLNKNVFNGGEWLNLSFIGNFQFKLNDDTRSNEFGIGSSLSFPRPVFFSYDKFNGSIPRTDVNFSYNYQSRPEYTRNILSLSAGYNGSLKNTLFYQLYPLQFNVVHLQNMDKSFWNTLRNDPFLRNAYQDHFDLGCGGLLYYTTNSDAIPKTSYFYSRLQLDVAGNVLSAFKGAMKKDDNGAGIIWGNPFSQYLRSELTLGRTVRFGKNDSQAIASRIVAGAGWAYGNSSALPFEKHFWGGGANSLRGWQTRSVGPGSSAMDKTFVIPNQTGDMKLEANLEWRYFLLWKLEGALFMDAGNIWTLEQTQSSASSFSIRNLGETLAANWGTGVRLNLNFLLLRVDMGMKIHDPARESKWLAPGQWIKKDGYAIHFGVGYPF